MKNKISFALVITILAAFAMACNFSASTASISSFKSAKDKEGKQETSTYKVGETIYANAEVAYAIEKVTVKFNLTDEKGAVQPGSDVKVDLPSSGTARYSLAIPAGFKSGKYTINAEMLNDKGEKKDNKTVSITIEGGSAPSSSAPSSDSKDDHAGDKDKDKDKDKDEDK